MSLSLNLNNYNEKDLLDQIEEAVTYTYPDTGMVLLLYTYEDYLYRSDTEKALIQELRERGVPIRIRLVAKRGPVKANTDWPFIDIPEPDWYRDEVIYTKKGR
jgi:hypothetical protein